MTPLPAPVRLDAASGSGAVHLHGAHLTEWTPAGAAPVLWSSARARFDTDSAIRGGVPIVFPWFGAGRSGALTPAHGFARLAQWHLLDVSADGDDVVALLGLDSHDVADDSFRFRFGARYQVRLGSRLHLSLTIVNRDAQAFSFEEALHTYLSVGDVRQVTVEGLDGHDYLDQVAGGGPRTVVQSGDLRFTGETDRIYAAGGPVRVVDPVLSRNLVIERSESASTVVWNPWVDKAQAMADFANDEWPSMLCVEGGNLRESAVTLEPGQEHIMRYAISLEPFV